MTPAEIAEKMQSLYDGQLLDILEYGELACKNGEPVLSDEGDPLRIAPSAAMMNVIGRRMRELSTDTSTANPVQEAIDRIRQAQTTGSSIPPMDVDNADAATGPV